jgi:hypothetical protein
MPTQTVWPINSDGSIILKNVSGSKTITGFLDQNTLPYAPDGAVPVVLSGQATPSSVSSNFTAAPSSDGAVYIATSAISITIPTGLSTGFGFSVKGVVTFVAGSGVTLNDLRTTGSASPWCCLVQIGTDQYDILGSKA